MIAGTDAGRPYRRIEVDRLVGAERRGESGAHGGLREGWDPLDRKSPLRSRTRPGRLGDANVSSVPGVRSSTSTGRPPRPGCPAARAARRRTPPRDPRRRPVGEPPILLVLQSAVIGSRSGVTVGLSWAASAAPSRCVNTRSARIGSHTHRSSTNCLAGYSISSRNSSRKASGSATPLSRSRRAMPASSNGPCSVRTVARIRFASNASATTTTLCRG